MSLSDDEQAGVIDAFSTASGCLDDVLNVGGVCFGSVVCQICPLGLQLSGAGASDTEATFICLRLSVSGGIVSTRVCDGRGDFDLEIVGFPFLDGDVPHSASCGVCISQLIRFAGASS